MPSAMETRHLPVIRREGITWRTAGTDVQISIALHNDSPEPTGEATLVIEAAAFGAFVPSKPVARITVAGFEPGERRRVVTRVARAQFDEIICAIEAAPNNGVQAERVAKFRRWMEVARSVVLSYPRANWVGNLNVYFDTAPNEAVERHVAFDLKVKAGSQSGFAFVLGDDLYAMETRCEDSSWGAKVFGGEEFEGYVIVTAPPLAGVKGKIDVLVTRQADEETVLVEFEMETVEAANDTLGCVKV